MTSEKRSKSDGPSRRTSRRRFLATTAGVSLVGLAGCSTSTNQEFEAPPVVLPEAARDEMVVAETVRDSSTISREIEQIDGEITITNGFSAYARGPARGQPTLLEKFLGTVNGTEGAGAGEVAAASDAGIDELVLDLPPVPSFRIPGDQSSLVVPEGVRSEERSNSPPLPSSMMVLAPVRENAQTSSPTRDATGLNGYFVGAEDFFPNKYWLREDATNGASKRWLNGDVDGAFLEEDDVRVLIVLGEKSPEEVFGISEEEMPGEKVATGNNPFLATGNNPFLLAALGNTFRATGNNPFTPEELFEVGAPAPLNGATYGLGVLSTPAAEVAGQSVNPIARLGFGELLTEERFGHLIGPNRLSKPDEVEWLAGPIPVSAVPVGVEFLEDSPDGTTILDQEADLRSFLGVVSGEDGPWGVGVHVARVEHERDGGTDVVVAAGTHRWPVASADAMDRLRDPDDERFTGILGSIIAEARTLTAAAGERLFPDFPTMDDT